MRWRNTSSVSEMLDGMLDELEWPSLEVHRDRCLIAQLIECPLSEWEVVGSNPAAAPDQRCKRWY